MTSSNVFVTFIEVLILDSWFVYMGDNRFYTSSLFFHNGYSDFLYVSSVNLETTIIFTNKTLHSNLIFVTIHVKLARNK